MSTSKRAFNELITCADLSIIEGDDDDLVEISGKDPILDTPFVAGEAVASALAAQAAAVSEIWKLKTGRRQHVSVDMKAALNSVVGLNNICQSGHHVDVGFLNEPTIGFYLIVNGSLF